jgi:hypothetical protein
VQSEDRIIHFSVELIHAPAQPKVQDLQKLYFELSQTRLGAYDSTDFTNPLQARFYSRRGKKTQSFALFLPDRIVLVEEWADGPLSDFQERVREVATRAMEICGTKQYLAHTATIRSTFALTHYDDARVFLMDHACAQDGKVGPHLQRPVSVGGLRFVLPETNEHEGALHITIESFRHSRDEVFVETKGVFARKPVGPDDIGIVIEHLRYTRSFVSNQIFSYLNQFDQVPDVNP